VKEVTVPVPEETMDALRLTPEAVGAELRLAAAMKLYEIGRLSSGTAARLAGISRPEFLQRLHEYGVNTFDLTESELLSDAESARGPL
jgi:predicted HTH domain antitoxin